VAKPALSGADSSIQRSPELLGEIRSQRIRHVVPAVARLRAGTIAQPSCGAMECDRNRAPSRRLRAAGGTLETVRTLAIAAISHLIPAPTIPNGDLELALGAPLADGRDEVIYLVCTHERIRFGEPPVRGRHPVLRASGELGGGISWKTVDPWAWVTLPENARPSAVPWAIIDPESGEPPRADHDADDAADPDGRDGVHREELLPWIYDRHLERSESAANGRGRVDGGAIRFRLEYIGKRRRNALRRPAGAHHRVSEILARTLLYEPHRLVYMLPCEIRIACYEESGSGRVKAERLEAAASTSGISRSLLSAVAEEALIAWLGPSYNVQNTGPRRFPRSASGERLATHSIGKVYVALAQLPEDISVRGDNALVDCVNSAHAFALA
jgi:hypothetical protein